MVSGDAVTSLTAPFMECHDVPRSVCAGFARTIGHESVKLRLFVSLRRCKKLELRSDSRLLSATGYAIT
jgi:uncharacterized protein YigA (DUF484 family)